MSSVFSFDTLHGVPRPTRAFWLAIGMCLAFRGVIVLNADRLDRIPTQCTNKRLMYIEQSLIRNNPVPPTIALTGSSLMRYGLVEDQIAIAAGVRPAEVVNIGLENGGAWEALVLLRRNPRFAANLRMVICAIQPAEVNRNARSRWIESFYQHSTLAERWAEDDRSNRVKLVLDWVWPYQSQHRDLPTWITGLLGQCEYDDPTGLKPAWNPPLYGRLKARASRYEKPPAAKDISGIRGDISQRHLRHLNDLIAFCRERNIDLHLMTTPTRRVYDQVVSSDTSLSEGLSRFEHLLDGLGVSTVITHRNPMRDSIGLDEHEDFLDYCHLSPVGASKLTHAVTADLRARNILPLADTCPPAFAVKTARSR